MSNPSCSSPAGDHDDTEWSKCFDTFTENLAKGQFLKGLYEKNVQQNHGTGLITITGSGHKLAQVVSGSSLISPVLSGLLSPTKLSSIPDMLEEAVQESDYDHLICPPPEPCDFGQFSDQNNNYSNYNDMSNCDLNIPAKEEKRILFSSLVRRNLLGEIPEEPAEFETHVLSRGHSTLLSNTSSRNSFISVNSGTFQNQNQTQTTSKLSIVQDPAAAGRKNENEKMAKDIVGSKAFSWADQLYNKATSLGAYLFSAGEDFATTFINSGQLYPKEDMVKTGNYKIRVYGNQVTLQAIFFNNEDPSIALRVVLQVAGLVRDESPSSFVSSVRLESTSWTMILKNEKGLVQIKFKNGVSPKGTRFYPPDELGTFTIDIPSKSQY